MEQTGQQALYSKEEKLALSLKTTVRAWCLTSGSHLATNGPEEEEKSHCLVAVLRQELDEILVRCLQWPPVYISWGRKKVGFRLDTYNWLPVCIS